MPEPSQVAAGVGRLSPPLCCSGSKRLVFNENNPAGLGEAASSKIHIGFQH